MIMKLSRIAVICVIAFTPVASLAAAPPSRSHPRTNFVDYGRHLDTNRLDLYLSNLGSIGYDLAASNSGLYYPRPSYLSILYASGLWACGKVGGQTRVTLAEYSFEWQPGGAPGGVPEDPNSPDHIVYKTSATDPSFAVRSGAGQPNPDLLVHHAWSQYVAGAAPHGAPTRTIRIDDTSTPTPGDSIDVLGPDLPGDLATWCTYNDLNPSAHTNNAGGTPPLGLEVRQTIYGYGAPGTALDDIAFLRFDVRNAGAATIDSAFFAFWADPDIGGASDDLTGWDGVNGMGYAYNATNTDLSYGSAVPAIGFMLLDSPVPSSPEHPFGASSFGRYINGTDPTSFQQSAWAMHGYQTSGQPWIDPATLQSSKFPFDGDPVAATGWLDDNASDRRLLVSVGPLTLASGQQTHLTFAIVAGRGTNRLASIEQLRCNASAVRAAWPNGLTRPFAPGLSACAPAAAPTCPWAAEAWSGECAAPVNLTSSQIEAIAFGFLYDSRSFDPGIQSPRDAFCGDVAEAGTARQRAERQYETLLANYGAQKRATLPTTGPPIGLPLDAAVSCPGVAATTVSELLERCPDGNLIADYVRVDTENPRDLEPVFWGGNAYEGGIGYGVDFLRTGLDPAAMPDSFRAVEIRFGPGQTQKAYRYLRLEATGGFLNDLRPVFRYGGYRDVPFRCVEKATGRTLEVMFVETALTDVFGTILPANQQPATFDSTWSPDASPEGGREYLLLTNRSAADGPRPEFATDGFPVNGGAPITYVAWLRRSSDTDAIENGEFIRILPEPPPSPGVDRAMLVLARADQADPATVLAYEGIASCLRAVNLGQLSPAACTGGTPALATLIEASATPEAVTLSWYVAGGSGDTYSLERRIESAEWTVLGAASVDGDGFVRYVDRAVVPGVRHAYRLVGAGVPQGEVSVAVPTGASGIAALAVGARFATGGTRALQLVLPSNGEVRYDVYSLAGRRLLGGSLGVLSAGHRTVPIPSAGSLAPGVYLVRVRAGDAEARTKAIVLQ